MNCYIVTSPGFDAGYEWADSHEEAARRRVGNLPHNSSICVIAITAKPGEATHLDSTRWFRVEVELTAFKALPVGGVA